MKKYLMTAMAAVAMGVAFTSCSHNTDLYGGEEGGGKINGRTAQEQIELDKAVYNAAFEQSFGKVAPTVDWGFGGYTRAMTRTITVNGDTYDKFPSTDDVAANFPTAIPEGAVEVAELFDTYNGQEVPTQWGTTKLDNIWAIYANIVTEGFNLKITQAGTTELGGSYQNAGWDQTAQKNLAYPYNVYVNVDGDVTLKRNGATHFNLYILKGNVTLESDYGEQAGLISVAAGATLNDRRNSIAANQGIKIFNKGTINATNAEKYDIGNFCTVYNEGKFNVTGALTYSPGDANTSYFMNLGDDAELTASAMTLNSAGNFYNDGKVVINGETNVTQKDIYWVNAGYYKTGSIVFSAKNATFYNYCQLIVTGNAHMYDGEFNLMPNSYTETATAEMDNFIVNMGGNAGINIKGAVRVIAQGDGTFQGFKNFGTNNYVLIGGKVTVDSHKKTFSVESGITYSIKEIEIVRWGSVVTEAQLQEEQSGDYPVLDLQGTEAPFGKLTVTPKEFGQGCGATWKKDGDEPETYRVIAEDLSARQGSDLDFNDVVFDIDPKDGGATITIRAAGGIWPLTLTVNGTEYEVHELLIPNNQKTVKFTHEGKEYDCYPMINTGNPDKDDNCASSNFYYPTIEVTGDYSTDEKMRDFISTIVLTVYKYCNKDDKKNPAVLEARKGLPACKMLVDQDCDINSEYEALKKKYNQFEAYVGGTFKGKWWKPNANN